MSKAGGALSRAALCVGDKTRARAYMTVMRKWIVFTPLFALLAGAIWFAASFWVHLAGAVIPIYGWFAIAGGAVFSLLVGSGLMALIFYSSRHGYDDLSGGDSGRK
jgi:hypothetical protein